MLAALASDIGCDVVDIAIGRDREDELARQIERWETFDAIIISGGVSTGKFDLVPGALRAVGAEIVFSDIRMRPGGRTIFARKRDSAFFCLPGSPIGAMVAFLMIARPGLLAMMASSAAVPTPFWLRTTARLDKEWTLTAGCAYGGGEVGANAETSGRTTGLRGRAARTWFVPARCVQSNRDEGLWVEPLAGHGVGGARVLARATCLIRIDEKTQSVEPNQMVDVFMLQTDGSFTGAAGI
jgi:molybdopterin molybdotransferase